MEAPLVTDVMALPEPERLPYALNLIRALSQPSDAMKQHLKDTIGSTPKEAAILHYLLQREGQPVSKEALYEAVCGPLSDVEIKIIDVWVCKVRKKLPEGADIKTHWGFGYSATPGSSDVLGRPIEAPITATPRCRDGNPLDSIRDRWTEEDDQNLAEMADSGSDLWAMAEEMGRTERAVRDRLKIVRPAWSMK